MGHRRALLGVGQSAWWSADVAPRGVPYAWVPGGPKRPRSELLGGSWPSLNRATTRSSPGDGGLQPRTLAVRRAHEPALARRSLVAEWRLRPVPTMPRPVPPPTTSYPSSVHSPLVPSQFPDKVPPLSSHFPPAPPTPRQTTPTLPSLARPRPTPPSCPWAPPRSRPRSACPGPAERRLSGMRSPDA